MAYYRTVIEVEVLSDGPYDPDALSDVAYDIGKGDHSGSWTITSSKEVSAAAMAELLQKQGSAPEFLLSEEDLEKVQATERPGDGLRDEASES